MDGTPVPLRPQSAKVLRLLLENHDELVTRPSLVSAVWGDRVVTGDSLAQCLVDIRRALSDFDNETILTLPGRGYVLQSKFVGANKRGTRAFANVSPRAWVIAGACSLLAIAVLGTRFIAPESLQDSNHAMPSVAVLPFADMTGTQDKRFLAEGMSEEILNQLATSREMKVIARTSSFSLGADRADIRSIAEKLSVSHIVEGSVREGDDRLRVTVQLIETTHGSHLWSQTFDRPFGDILEIQSEIAKSVADALHVALDLSDSAGANPYAHALVIQARSQLRMLDPESNRQAQRLLHKALEIEPDYVPALVVLAQAAFHDRGAGGRSGYRAAWERSIEITNRALALDPNHPVALAQRGWAELYYYQDYPSAARSFEKATRLDADNPEVMRLATNAMLVFDRPDLGMQLGQYAVERDPLCVLCHVFLTLTARVAGDLELAESAVRRLIAMNPDYPASYELLGAVLLAKGEAAAALAAYKQYPGNPDWVTEDIAVAHYRLGNIDEFNRLKNRLIETHAEKSPAAIARLESVAGNIDEAFAWLEKHLAQPKWTRGASYHHSSFDNLRSDPRWNSYRHRFGLSAEQLAQIDFEPTMPF